jgi:hypothetical protein
MIAAEQHGVTGIQFPGDDDDDDGDNVENELRTYTFMAWNSLSLTHLPHGYGAEFPAFLTHRSGADFCLIDMMRTFFNKGVRYEKSLHA